MPIANDPIRHVVVLILENHSFDQMLGCFKQVYPFLEGIDPANPRRNTDHDGQVYAQAPTTERMMFLDPHHEVPHVTEQLANHNGGFVSNYSSNYPGTHTARGLATRLQRDPAALGHRLADARCLCGQVHRATGPRRCARGGLRAPAPYHRAVQPPDSNGNWIKVGGNVTDR